MLSQHFKANRWVLSAKIPSVIGCHWIGLTRVWGETKTDGNHVFVLHRHVKWLPHPVCVHPLLIMFSALFCGPTISSWIDETEMWNTSTPNMGTHLQV